MQEREENLRMENEQMTTVNELLDNRKNNIFYTSDTSFDDAVTVRLTDFNQEQEIEKTREKQKKILKIMRISFIIVSVVFFLLSYPVLGLMIGY